MAPPPPGDAPADEPVDEGDDEGDESASPAALGLRPGVLLALLATLSALVFVPALGGGFIWDDNLLIENNGLIRSLSSWPYWFTHDFWDFGEESARFGDSMRYFRPAITASYAIDWNLGGGSPLVFHLTNLAWHAAAAGLVFRALERWTGAPAAAALATLLFAVHPTKAESVAWISGRTDAVCLAAMLLVCELDLRRRADPERRWQWLGLEALGTAFAYASKEQAICIPLLLAVEAWAEAERPPLSPAALRSMLKRALPQLGVAAGYLGLRMVLLPVHSQVPLSLGDRARMFFESTGRFASLIFVPHDLSLQHGLVRSQAGRPAFDATYVALGAAFVVVLASLGWAARRRLPGVAVGLGLFAALLLPTSNLVPTGMHTLISERFLYAPLLGLALAAGCLLARLPARRRALGFGLAAAASLGCGVGAARRAHDFSDEEAFWQREHRLHPESFEALMYFARRDRSARNFQGSLYWTGRATEVVVTQFGHLGLEAKFIPAGAQLVLQLTPDRDEPTLAALDTFFAQLANEKRGVARLQTGALDVSLALSHPPNRVRLDNYRPRMLALRAEIASRRGNDDDAVRLAQEAARACAGCGEVGNFSAVALARASRYTEADAVLDAVARRSSEHEVERTRSMLKHARQLAQQASAVPNGPLRLQLRAQELATLEAWGRAYGVLAPHKEAIKEAPGMLLGFAELAFRAGDRAVAREMLALAVPAEAREATEGDWARKMGWLPPASGPSAR